VGNGVALGDLVRVTVYPRSGKISLTVTSSPRTQSAAEEPAEPAVTPRVGGEVAKLSLTGPIRAQGPDLLRTLAATLAGRLAAPADGCP
jgi:hypothetical protein